jgi:sugar phosphate isomerase/epimerase
VRWEIGISTGIGYRHPIEESLPAIREAGFTALEICTAPQHLDLARRESWPALKRRIQDLGLSVRSLHAPFGHDVNISSPDHGERGRAVDRLTLAADLLTLLGGGLYVIHPGGEDQRWVWERDARLARSVEVLTQMWEACRARGICLVVETPLPHLLGGQPSDLDWILARLPRDHVGVCIDTSHCALGGCLLESVARLADRLVYVQASDNHGRFDDHLPPGDGNLDWEHFCGALEAVDYRGPFVLEVAGNGDVGERLRALKTSVARALPWAHPLR